VKTEIVRYMIHEIEEEQEREKRYKAECQRAQKESEKTGKSWWACKRWNEPYPKKRRIIENCKVARRLLQEIARGAQNG